MNVLRCSSIGYFINNRQIFKGIDYSFESSKITALVGVSGSGKSSLLNILGLITNPTYGEIYIDGVLANKWSEKKRIDFWRERASFIFQDYGIVSDESVGYNITLKDKISNKEKVEVEKILEHVGLKDRYNDKAEVLSGGEKQRLGVARAIYKKSDIIFADEPTASLDIENKEMVVNLLKERALEGATVILATHDESLISECDYVLKL